MASPIEFDAGAREDFDDALVRPLIEIDVVSNLTSINPISPILITDSVIYASQRTSMRRCLSMSKPTLGVFT